LGPLICRRITRESEGGVSGWGMSGVKGPAKPITAALLHASFFLCVYSALAGADRAFGCAVIWPANAIAVTAFLLASRVRWSLHLPALFGSLLVANLLNNVAPAAALGFASANVVEIFVASALLREVRFLAAGFTRLASTVQFIAVCGIVAPLLSSLLGAATIAIVLGKSPTHAFLSWFAADTLGLLVVIPTCLALFESSQRAVPQDQFASHATSRWERYATFALFLAIAAWVLTKPLGEDSFGLRRLHFVVFGLIWLAVRHGSSLTMLANFAVAIGALATARMGFGPFVFEDTSLAWALVDAQLFVVVMTTAILLVHAVVDERRDSMRDAMALRILAEERNSLLMASSEALAEAVHEAQTANRTKSEFLANMSHEIRTPLTAIIGYAELVEHSLPEHAAADTVQSLRTIRRNGDHLLQIINDILDLSKIEAEQLAILREPVALCDLMREVVRLLEGRAREKGIELRLIFRGLVPETLHTDALRLKQVLINLIGNAIKFTDQGSVEFTVEVVEGEAHAALEFRVTDTGIGMTRQQLNRLFQPFTQADASTSRRFGGTGLGLAISQRIAKKLGGGIEVTSELGVGSTFTLRLPLTPEECARLIRPNLNAPAATEARQRSLRFSRACQILLAEDGLDNQRLIRRLLESAGATVRVADDGVAACEAVESGQGSPFDVILMDMQMPRLDGYAATRRLRKVGCTTPIIALTANAMAGDSEKCLLAGCDDYLAKPITRDRLLAAVEKQLTSSRVWAK